MNLAPIVLFVYNRPWHTRKTIEALKRNVLTKESNLFIFSDGPQDDDNGDKLKVAAVRDYIDNIDGFNKVEIIKRNENFGLAKSITNGVTDIVNKFGRIIVLEDDLVTSPYFLTYMNEALELYKNNEKVISIHGYTYPTKKELPETFFIKGADCWGWATWKRGWDKFNIDAEKLYNEIEQKGLSKEFDFNGSHD
jgi:GT2 family glycosyltransferase